jgi:hypothetical protein
MKELNVQHDGACLFRCVACFITPELLKVTRYSTGRIRYAYESKKEDALSTGLRACVVSVMEDKKDYYSKKIKYNDTTLYPTLEDRIEKMGASDEYAGLLEIKILCKLLKININIFMDHNGEFNLVSSMGTKYKRECNLVLRDEYYSLIRPNIQKKIDTREPYSRSVRRRKNYTGYSPGI